MRIVAALALLLSAPGLIADGLTDVQAALRRLGALEPIRATYDLERNINNKGKLTNDKLTGRASVELEGERGGFRIVYPRPLLEQIEREQQARAKNPSLETPTVTALRDLDVISTADAIDFAPAMLRMLEGAKVLSDGPGTWAGKPVRVLILRPTDKLDKDDASRFKVLDNRLTLWLGADHVPLAAEHNLTSRLSFLIFKGEMKAKRSWHFTRLADRLVRHRHELSSRVHITFQDFSEDLVATVRVH
jgi:hypothetical protein